jgi:hypothetical protein
LIYPSGTDSLDQLPISDWHETIASSDLSNFFQWDSQTSNTHINARVNTEEIPIRPKVSVSLDGKTIWFDFDPIQIPIEEGMSGTPVTLDIVKQVRWVGPVLDPLPTSHYIDLLVNEYPTIPGPVGDYNGNGIIDAADYVVWRKGLDTTYIQSAYDVWRAHFGQTAGSGSGASANAVPEPASALMLLMGVLVMCSRYCAAASLIHQRMALIKNRPLF